MDLARELTLGSLAAIPRKRPLGELEEGHRTATGPQAVTLGRFGRRHPAPASTRARGPHSGKSKSDWHQAAIMPQPNPGKECLLS